MITPIVGVPADMVSDEAPCHRVKHKYLDVIDSLGATAVIIPAMGQKAMPLLPLLNGILLPGSRFNIAPALYGRAQEMEKPWNNHERDATTLPLIRAAIEAGVPLFAICRGIQELNVALGGTLHQQIDRMPGRIRHQFEDENDFEKIFGPSHEISAVPGSKLLRWVGRERIMVNSMHNQAIDDLAPGLAIEGTADDGTIEAVCYTAGKAYTYGVQWHPEYKFSENPVSVALFEAFGAAVKAHANLPKAYI